jgi:hypothetical protein
MKLITHTGEDFAKYDPSTVEPNPTNEDCTDFPMKGCKQCGRRDRPQWKGQCNDDRCSYEN